MKERLAPVEQKLLLSQPIQTNRKQSCHFRFPPDREYHPKLPQKLDETLTFTGELMREK